MTTCIEAVLSQSYLHVVFLFIYAAMWSMDMEFDTRLYALLYVLLSYTRQSCVNHFNFAIRDILNYLTAEKRIRVCFNYILILTKSFRISPLEILAFR